MKKDLILVAFPSMERGTFYVKDNILPLINLKKKSNYMFENDSLIITIVSLQTPHMIRGYSPDFVFVSDDCTIHSYKLILELVKGDHNKIKVVI